MPLMLHGVSGWLSSNSKLGQEILITMDSWKLSCTGLKVRIFDYHLKRKMSRWYMLRRPHAIPSYQRVNSDMLSPLMALAVSRGLIGNGKYCMEPYTVSYGSYQWTGWIKSGCRAESSRTGYGYYWVREVANTLHWLMDGSKCCMGVAGKLDKSQLEENPSWLLKYGKTLLTR